MNRPYEISGIVHLESKATVFGRTIKQIVDECDVSFHFFKHNGFS